MEKKQKLELTWIGKENRPNFESRILIEDLSVSYHAKKRYSKNDLFDNKIIYGDNLLGLKALEFEYTGKIKCVYIDPPYNTESFQNEYYDDNLDHSIWLSRMSYRIEVIKKLLSNDGFLAIQIDDHNYAWLYLLMVEAFGQNNLKTICVKMSEATGVKMASVLRSGTIPKLKEYIILAGKNGIKGLHAEKIPKESWDREYSLIVLNKSIEEIEFIKSVIEDENRSNESIEEANNILSDMNVSHVNDFMESNQIPTLQKDTFCFENAWRIIRTVSMAGGARLIADKYSKSNTDAKFFLISTKENKCYVIKNGYDHAVSEPRIKALFADDYLTIHPGDFWQDISTTGLGNEGGVNFKNGKKPEALVKRIIGMCSNPGDLILDSFGGSGTTAAVAHKMNRRWITIEMGDHCHSHILVRLKNVINGNDTSGVTNLMNWKGGGGFRYYKLAPSLLEKDKWGQWVINKEYNANMLASAICKHEGFIYSPSETEWWNHGNSTENDFIYVTTQIMTEDQLLALSEDVGSNRTLLICCSAFKVSSDLLNNKLSNLTLKKIPNAIMSQCEWGKDDYSLNIDNLHQAELEEVIHKVKPSKKDKTENLFNEEN